MNAQPYPRFLLPRAVRIYVCAFGALWCSFVALALFASVVARTAAALIPLGMLAFGGYFFYRTLRMGVVTSADEMLVRNWWRTWRVRRRDIEDFRIGGAGPMVMFGKSIYALLADGTILPLDVLARPMFFSFWGRRLNTALAQLKAWADDKDGPGVNDLARHVSSMS